MARDVRTIAAYGFLVAGVVTAGASARTLFAAPDPVRIAYHRGLTSVAPPWSFAEGASRFLPLVAQPACEPQPGDVAAYAGGAVAECKVDGTEVRLTPHALVRRGADPVSALELWGGLEWINEDVSTQGGHVLHREDAGDLLLTPPRGTSPAVMARLLALAPVAWWDREKPCTIEGTGPYEVVSIIAAPDPEAKENDKLAGCRGSIPATELGTQVTDRVVLRKRWGLQEVEIYGLATGESSDADPAGTAVAMAWLHLAFPWRQEGSAAVTKFRVNNRMLYLAANPNPGRLRMEARDNAIGLFRLLLADPELTRSLDVVPVGGPTPVGFPGYGREPAALDGGAPCPDRPLIVLANEGWKAIGHRLVDRANADCPGAFALDVVTPQQDQARRRDRDYDLSLLADVAMIPDSPLYYVDLLSAWLRDGHEPPMDCGPDGLLPTSECGNRIIGDRLPGWEKRFDTFVTETSQWVVPVGQVPVYGAYSPRLRGFDPGTVRIDPALLALDRTEGTAVWSGSVGLLLIFLSTNLLVLQQRARQERARWATLRHDLEAPFKTVVAYTSLLDERSRGSGAAISDEVGRVRARILALSSTMGAAPPLSDGLDVWREAVAPALRAIEARARAQGLTDIGIEAVPGPVPLRVNVSLAAVRTALDNLLDNALKYREGDVLRIRVEAIPRPDQGAIVVSDEGTGLVARELTWIQGARGSRAVASGIPGEGLGLASARAALRAEGGDLELASPRAPTTFRILLPYGPLRGVHARPDGG